MDGLRNRRRIKEGRKEGRKEGDEDQRSRRRSRSIESMKYRILLSDRERERERILLLLLLNMEVGTRKLLDWTSRMDGRPEGLGLGRVWNFPDNIT